jgi:serine/threonine protein kinase/Tol biopolymer transport system component
MGGPGNRVSDLYHQALEREPERRSAFLQAACGGDDDLRAAVESLLRYEPQAGGFLARPPGMDDDAPAADHGSMIDRQLGPYTILALLGAGGMGEVYRARDTKLGREVALKILPPHLTAEPERRARFAREARLLATLNHPHIGAIYGLEESDGITALVLELVEGETLADRLTRGPLRVPHALAIARQIADALDAAHEKRIVHRDLKPANIVLQRDSGSGPGDVRVKVLDFGLAKSVAIGRDDDSMAPPETSLSGTEDGRILGTPAYLSPEQARGQPVDKRTDIWAFGCVLFEMLSGKRPFDGATVSDTLAGILEHAPDWTVLPAAVPAAVRTLLRRCLEKEPARRLRDIGDARLEIEEVLTAPPSTPAAVAAPHLPGSGVRRRLLMASVAVMLTMLALWFYVRPMGTESSTAPALQITRLTFDEGLQTDPTLQPDGRFIAYPANTAGNFDIYTQPVGGGNAVRVTSHAAHDWQPDWSITDQLVFRSEREGGGLYVVAPTGGHEQRIASFGYQPRWSPDGRHVLLTSSSISTALHIATPAGATPRECQPCSEVLLKYPVPHGTGAFGWARDSQHVAILVSEAAPQYRPHLWLVDVEHAAREEWTVDPGVLTAFHELRIFIPSRPLAWSSNARAVYFVGNSRGVAAVWKLDVDPDARTISGGPHRMTTTAEESTGVAIARTTDTIAFAARQGNPRIWWHRLDASGRRTIGPPEALTPAEALALDPDVTPDGRLLVFSLQRPGGSGGIELSMQSLADRVIRTLRVNDTARGEARGQPHVSPDGRHVVHRYVAPESTGRGRGGGAFGPQDLRIVDLATFEESRLTRTAAGVVLPGGWSPDSRFVVARVARQRIPADAIGTAIGLLPLSAAPDAEARMKIVTTFEGELYQPSMSPDGRWLVFVTTEHGASRIAVVGSADGLWSEPVAPRGWLYPDPDPSRQDKPRWSADGRMLYFVSARGGLLNVWAVEFNPVTGAIGAPFRVTDFDGPGERMPTNMYSLEIGVARGGLAIPTLHPTGAIWLLHPAR